VRRTLEMDQIATSKEARSERDELQHSSKLVRKSWEARKDYFGWTPKNFIWDLRKY